MARDQKRNKSGSKVDRRGFLSRLGAGAAGAAAYAGTSPAAEPAKKAPQPAAEVAPDERELAERRVRNQAARAIKHTAKPNGLNLVVIIADTFRPDHLGAYGPSRAKTPHLDQFARDGVLFKNAFADGLPTIPCRRCYHTGKSVVPPGGLDSASRRRGEPGPDPRRPATGPGWCRTSTTISSPTTTFTRASTPGSGSEARRGTHVGGPKEKFQPKDTCRPTCGTRPTTATCGST